MAIVTKGVMPTLIRLKRSEEIIIACISDKSGMSWEHAFDESEGECIKDCSDFVEADLRKALLSKAKQG